MYNIINKYNIFCLTIILLYVLFPETFILNSKSMIGTILEIILILGLTFYNKYLGLFMCMFVLYVRGKSVYEGASSAKYKKGDSVKVLLDKYPGRADAKIESVDTSYYVPLYNVKYKDYAYRNIKEDLINESFINSFKNKTLYFLRNNKYKLVTDYHINSDIYISLTVDGKEYPDSNDTTNIAYRSTSKKFMIATLYRTNQLKNAPGRIFNIGDKVFATEKNGTVYYAATIVGVDSTKEDIYSITYDNDDSKNKYDNISVTNLAIGSELHGVNHDYLNDYYTYNYDDTIGSTYFAKSSVMNIINAFKQIFPNPVTMKNSLIGPIGPTGPTGKSSVPGNTGTRGIDGTKGDIGTKGIPGLKGLIGLAGPIGNTGIDGPTGNNGIDGVTGPTGPIGPTGESIIGAPGPMGDTGPKGPDGDIGPLGPINTNYILSNTGPTGPTGPTGKDGDKGNKGPIGKTGLTGTTYILSGTTSSGTTRTGLTGPITTASGSTDRSNGKMNEIMNTFQTLYQNFKFLTNQQ